MYPAISVILTTHNRPKLLARALKSLIDQDFSDFEIILCADEGLRETKEVAFRLLRNSDSFISVPHFKGPAETRNFGIAMASGRHICFLDDDDSFPPEYLLMASKFLSDSNEIHYSNYYQVLENNETNKIDIGKYFVEELMVINFIPNSALFVPTLIAKNHLFDVRLQSHEDWDWLIGLKSKNYVFRHHPIFGPNVHINDGLSRNNDALKSKSIGLDFLSIYRKYPAESEAQKIARQEMLKKYGMGSPLRFL